MIFFNTILLVTMTSASLDTLKRANVQPFLSFISILHSPLFVDIRALGPVAFVQVGIDAIDIPLSVSDKELELTTFVVNRSADATPWSQLKGGAIEASAVLPTFVTAFHEFPEFERRPRRLGIDVINADLGLVSIRVSHGPQWTDCVCSTCG